MRFNAGEPFGVHPSNGLVGVGVDASTLKKIRQVGVACNVGLKIPSENLPGVRTQRHAADGMPASGSMDAARDVNAPIRRRQHGQVFEAVSVSGSNRPSVSGFAPVGGNQYGPIARPEAPLADISHRRARIVDINRNVVHGVRDRSPVREVSGPGYGIRRDAGVWNGRHMNSSESGGVPRHDGDELFQLIETLND